MHRLQDRLVGTIVIVRSATLAHSGRLVPFVETTHLSRSTVQYAAQTRNGTTAKNRTTKNKLAPGD